MYLFGKNNNHLIKNNHKITFSLPQKIRLIQKQIIKCACGHDFIICLSKSLQTYCYFQSAIYNIDFKHQQKIVDLALNENLILFLNQNGQLYATQFMAEKLINDSLKPKIINLSIPLAFKSQKIIQIKMIKKFIFIKLQNNLFFFFEQNNWTQTKIFSDPQYVFGSKSLIIEDITHQKNNFYFLTSDGDLYSSKETQLQHSIQKIQIKEKLKKIKSSEEVLYAITQQGYIVKIHLKNSKNRFEKISKLTIRFVDLAVSSQNLFGITQDLEAWVCGKNAYGQLGLSDYEPRNTLYPLVSLQRFYIKNFFVGQNYVCCIVNQTRFRSSAKISERSSFFQSTKRQVNGYQSKNTKFNQYRDSFNQTEQFLMPIQYIENKEKVIIKTENQNSKEVNIIVNKKYDLENFNLFKKSNKNQQKKLNLSDYQRSSSRSKIQSRVLCKCHPDYSNNEIRSKSISKLTPKSTKIDNNIFKNGILKNDLSVLAISDTGKSNNKNKKKQIFLNQKTPNKRYLQNQKFLKQKIKQLQTQFAQQIEEHSRVQNQKIRQINSLNKIETQKLKEIIQSVRNQLQNKVCENRDLFELISQKNEVINDITSKIRLLEEAIAQHEKSLTARDNQAEQYFIRQKQYQLHISKLQSQVEKMIQMLNSNQRNREAQIYRKQMEKLSIQTKQRIQGEKQYYHERIKFLQKKFEEQKNIYQLQIRTLQDQISLYKNNQVILLQKIKQQNGLTSLQLAASCLQNNPPNFLESPTFHTIDIKQNLKKKNEKNYSLNKSQQINDQINANETVPLRESNRQNQNYRSSLTQNKSEAKTKNNTCYKNSANELQSENYLQQKSESQVKEILSKIQKNKFCISKSANKLFNLLQNDRL